MANVMSLKNLRNKVSRNGYDLSFKNAFTAKVGELLPVGTWMCLPGDKFKINVDWFTRTQPVNTAAYARFREYYDFYAVPISLLWRDAPSFFINMDDNRSALGITDVPRPVIDRHPYIRTQDVAKYLFETHKGFTSGGSDVTDFNKNYFGYNRALQTCKLLEYLGYGRFYDCCETDYSDIITKRFLNPFPLLAYQKIYSDYWRNSQWERVQPERFNVDYLSNGGYYNINSAIPLPDLYSSVGDYKGYKQFNLLDINYCNWNKDYFMGVLPRAQYGDEAVARPLVGSQSFSVSNDDSQGNVTLTSDASLNSNNGLYQSDSGLGLGAIALRRAEFLQRYKEISLTGEKNYQDQIAKHWNVNVGDHLSGRCRYLGGTSTNVDIGEVVNNNLTGDNQADIAGKGTSAGRGHISYDVKEHCIIMCVYHSVPLLDYTSDIPQSYSFFNSFSDYPIPELDKIGMQQVYVGDLISYPQLLDGSPGAPEGGSWDELLQTPIGWAPRYYNFKSTFDQVRGGFCDTLASWVVPMSPKYLNDYFLRQWNMGKNVGIDYSFFKVNPNIADTIFAVNADDTLNTDQFLVNSFFDVKVVRNLDYDGLPY